MSALRGELELAVGRLLEAGFTREEAEEAVTALRPVVGIEFEQEAVPLGGSKIGGRPHVPGSFVWPGDLAFVAQINFAECKPFDFAGVLPSAGIMYVFNTCEEGEIGAGNEGDDVVRYYTGPLSDLTVADFPDEVHKVEGRFVERRMVFSTSYVLATEEELGEGRPSDRDEDVLAAVGGAPDGARMLGQPHFFRPELDGSFDPQVNALLLALSGMELWRSDDDQASIYGDGEFFVIVLSDALRDEKIEDAWVLVESGT